MSQTEALTHDASADRFVGVLYAYWEMPAVLVAVKTLAVAIYLQPLPKAMRGVNVDGVVAMLLDHCSLADAGRCDVPEYAATRRARLR